MHNRRRFLQILAAAPFAPWREIAEELAKPIRTYSIPEAKREIQYALKKSSLSMTFAGSQFFDVGDEITIFKGDGIERGTFTISHVDTIGRVLYFDAIPMKIDARILK